MPKKNVSVDYLHGKQHEGVIANFLSTNGKIDINAKRPFIEGDPGKERGYVMVHMG